MTLTKQPLEKLPERSDLSKNDGLPAKDGSEATEGNQVFRYVPESLQGTYLRAISGEAPPRQAIKAFCLSCVAWDRKEVRLCGDTACPLYRYRPYVGKEVEK